MVYCFNLNYIHTLYDFWAFVYMTCAVSVIGWFRRNPTVQEKKAFHLPPFTLQHHFVPYLLKCLFIFGPAEFAPPLLHAPIPVKWLPFALSCHAAAGGGEKGNIRKIVQRCESGTVLFVKMFLLDGVNKWIAYCRLSVQDAQIFMISGFSSSWIFISLSWIRIRPHPRQSAAHVSVHLYEGIFITVQSLVSQPGVRPTIF